MNTVNRISTSIFDVLTKPLAPLGPEWSLVLLSGLFGILALIVFKFISFQKGVKAVKDKIKGSMIEIRLYQNDLATVAKAVGRVLLRNVQYLGMNFLPILPLMIPFILVAAQFVVRYAFAPVPVEAPMEGTRIAGSGTTVSVAMERGDEALVADLSVEASDNIELVTPLVRNALTGQAWVEVAAVQPGIGNIAFVLPDGQRIEKEIRTGEAGAPDPMQPERVSSFLPAWLWPAEDTLSETPFEHVKFTYPNRDLRYMPDGPLGVLIVFLIASMAFGILILKPLGIQI